MTDVTLRELTDHERLDARERARKVLLREIGDKPTRADYAGVTVSDFPRWVTWLVSGLMLVVFVAAAAPSLFRLYEAGYTYHLNGIDNRVQAAIVGVATFLLAEFLIITSTLAASIFYKGKARGVFAIPIALGLLVAFVGNWTVVQPHDLFAWLETLVPPLAVLVMSFVGERLILDAVKQQHADERAFQEALADWQQATRDVEQHERWRVVYGRALVQAIREANTGGSGTRAREDLMNTMSRPQWAALVRHEMEIERGAWLTAEPTEKPPTVTETPTQQAESPTKGKAKAAVSRGMSYHHAPGASANIAAMPNGNGLTAAVNGNGHK